MVQATQVKFTDKTSTLLQKIKDDLTKIFGEGKIRIEAVKEPVKYGYSVDIKYLHRIGLKKLGFHYFSLLYFL
jgi:hypothetical protein